MRRLGRELGGYAMASAIALACDFSLLFVLVEVASWHYLAAATTSFMAGAVVAYFLSIRLAFRYRRLDDRRKEFVLFAAVGVMGVAINAVTIHWLVEGWQVQYLLAKGSATILTFCSNFVVRRWLLFSPRWTPSHAGPNQS